MNVSVDGKVAEVVAGIRCRVHPLRQAGEPQQQIGNRVSAQTRENEGAPGNEVKKSVDLDETTSDSSFDAVTASDPGQAVVELKGSILAPLRQIVRLNC